MEEIRRQIVIDYAPRDYFSSSLHNNKERFITVVAHRQSGKSVASINHLIRSAIMNQGTYAYVAPNYRMAKRIAWSYLKDYSKPIPSMDYNEAELSAIFPNKSKIYLLGAEGYDSLRGLTLSGCIVDEAADVPEQAITEVLLPALSIKKGYLILIGTPKGKDNHLYNYAANWSSTVLSYEDTKVLDNEAIEDLRKNMPDPVFRQEMECEFLSEKVDQFFTGVDSIVTLPSLSKNGNNCYIGVDYGHNVDFTVITVLDQQHRLIDFERFQYDWLATKRIISDMARKYNAQVVFDATATQDVMVEELRALEVNVEGFKFTQESKKNLMNKLNSFISQKLISIPNIPELISELKNFSYLNMKAKSGHDDAVCSLAMAVWKMPQEVYNEIDNNSWLAYNLSNKHGI